MKKNDTCITGLRAILPWDSFLLQPSFYTFNCVSRNFCGIDCQTEIMKIIVFSHDWMDEQGAAGRSLTDKNKAYRRWKQGQVIWEEYRDIIQICREGDRKAEVQLELYVARDLKGIRYISNKRKTMECVGLLLNGNLVTKDKQKANTIHQCFLCLSLYWWDKPSAIPGPWNQCESPGHNIYWSRWSRLKFGNTRTNWMYTRPWRDGLKSAKGTV